jgi:hypothetical protein
MEMMENITEGGVLLAIIIRGEKSPEETTFLTPPEATLQAGFVVYPAGGEIARHAHLPLERRIDSTSEAIVVREGLCEMDIYNDKREVVATREMSAGDIVVLLAGGHGFRVREDTVLFEVKQGPYIGLEEKERF